VCFCEKTKLFRRDEYDGVGDERVLRISLHKLVEVLYCECREIIASAEMM